MYSYIYMGLKKYIASVEKKELMCRQMYVQLELLAIGKIHFCHNWPEPQDIAIFIKPKRNPVYKCTGSRFY